MPGEAALAQLRLVDPLLLLPGDRFIIRRFSPVITIGGGTVLDAAPLLKPLKGDVESFLTVLADSDFETVLKARVARRGQGGLSVAQAVVETGWRRELIESYLEDSIAKCQIIRVGDLLLQAGVIEGLKTSLLGRLTEFHKRNALVPGVSRESLREEFNLRPEVFAALLDGLVREKRLEVSGEIVRLPGHGIVMKDEEAESKKMIEGAFRLAGLKVPALQDVLAGLKVDRSRAQKIVTLLLREKVLVKISENLVFHRDALEDLRKRLGVQKTSSARIDVARFKDLAGVSRKYAIPLLEYLDREHVTRRVGDERVIL
jgi:selenocysteine-specific elongation factor